MSRLIAWGLSVGLAFGLTSGGCTTEDSGGDNCDPGETRACTCDDGGSSEQICNAQGSGFSTCQCDGGDGGSGGGSAGDGGSGGNEVDASTGGMSGSGGSVTDASTDAADSSASDGSDGDAGDGGDISPCNACLLVACNDELAACDGDPCLTPGDAGFNETDCMFVCLDEIFADGGVAGVGEVNHCADICGAGGDPVTTATENLFLCMFGAADAATDCKADCGY